MIVSISCTIVCQPNTFSNFRSEKLLQWYKLSSRRLKSDRLARLTWPVLGVQALVPYQWQGFQTAWSVVYCLEKQLKDNLYYPHFFQSATFFSSCCALKSISTLLSPLDMVNHINQPVDLIFRVVEGKRRAHGALNAEAAQ